MTNTRAKIANLIKIQRIKKGITQDEVAEAIGVSKETYARLENNTFGIALDTYLLAANILEVDFVKESSLITKEYLHKLLSKNIGRLRRAKGFTVATLAKKSGLEYHTIHSYSTGKSMPSLRSIKALCLAFECEPDDLWTTGDQKKLDIEEVVKSIDDRLTKVEQLFGMTSKIISQQL